MQAETPLAALPRCPLSRPHPAALQASLATACSPPGAVSCLGAWLCQQACLLTHQPTCQSLAECCPWQKCPGWSDPWEATGQRKCCCALLPCGWTVALGIGIWFQLSSLQEPALRGLVLLNGDKNIPGVILSVIGPRGQKGVGLLAEARVKGRSATSDLCFPRRYPPKIVNLRRECEFTLPVR